MTRNGEEWCVVVFVVIVGCCCCCFFQDKDITEMSSLREAGEKAGISGGVLDKMETLIQTDTVKEKLKQRTQEALDLGVSYVQRLRYI